MATVAIPYALATSVDLPPRAVKVYVALAAAGWPEGLSVRGVSRLAGMPWHTADRAIADLCEGGWLTWDLEPRVRG